METTSHTAPSRPGWATIAGILVLLLLFAFAAKLLLGIIPPPVDEDAARGEERAKALVAYQEENQAKLEGYAWADKAQGQVQIPITRAMEMTMADLNSRQPAAAGPINPPPAPAAPAPEAAPAPDAPAASPEASPAAQPSPTPAAQPAQS